MDKSMSWISKRIIMIDYAVNSNTYTLQMKLVNRLISLPLTDNRGISGRLITLTFDNTSIPETNALLDYNNGENLILTACKEYSDIIFTTRLLDNKQCSMNKYLKTSAQEELSRDDFVKGLASVISAILTVATRQTNGKIYNSVHICFVPDLLKRKCFFKIDTTGFRRV